MADFRSPEVEYKDDDKDPENIVQIEVDIPKLKKSLFSKTASNAEVTMEYPNNRSFTLTVSVQGNPEKFQYAVNKLPDEIDKSKSTCKVKQDGVVSIRLRKMSPRLWRELATVGLEAGDS